MAALRKLLWQPRWRVLSADEFLQGASRSAGITATCTESENVTQLSFVSKHDPILTAQKNKSDATAAVLSGAAQEST